jgi:N-acetylglucosamine repressor
MAKRRAREQTNPLVIKKAIMSRKEADMIRLTRREGGMSRVQIAKAMNMSPSAIAPYAERLLAEGWLLEQENVIEGRGRPRTPLTPNPGAGAFIGAEIGLRFVRVLRLDFAQNIQRTERYEVGEHCSKDRILTLLRDGIRRAVGGDASAVLGCGIAVNGAIDAERGVSRLWREVSGWKDVPIGDMIRGDLGIPVLLESNNHCLALSELWFGKGRDETSFLCLSARMTVGATLVIDGEPWRGAHGNSGLIGSWTVPSSILPEGARLRGEAPFSEDYGIPLMQVASTQGLLSRIHRSVREGRSSRLEDSEEPFFRFPLIVEAYRSGDEVVRAHILAAARALGWAAAELSKLFDVSLIIVSGLRMMGPLALEEIRRVAAERLHDPLHARPRIEASELFEFASSLGAAGLVIHRWGPRLDLC